MRGNLSFLGVYLLTIIVTGILVHLYAGPEFLFGQHDF
jgi:hypothetical protein